MIMHVVSNIAEFKKKIDAWDKLKFKAAVDAAKIEGYRLRGVLKDEIKKGAPGGMAFSPMSEINKRWRGERQDTKGNWKASFPPLYNLERAIKYVSDVNKDTGDVIVSVGFVGRTSRAQNADHSKPYISNTWQSIANKHQEGFGTHINEVHTRWGEPMRKFLIRMGYTETAFSTGIFTLRKSTVRTQTPARPIIAPFWIKHRPEANKNIVKNFEIKMAGGRV